MLECTAAYNTQRYGRRRCIAHLHKPKAHQLIEICEQRRALSSAPTSLALHGWTPGLIHCSSSIFSPSCRCREHCLLCEAFGEHWRELRLPYHNWLRNAVVCPACWTHGEERERDRLTPHTPALARHSLYLPLLYVRVRLITFLRPALECGDRSACMWLRVLPLVCHSIAKQYAVLY